MPQTVGVAAIQGDFEKHIISLQSLANPPQTKPVRTPEDLAQVDRLIIPGGESTTVGLLMDRYGLGQAIIDRANQGMPIWGTCMGMILLAKEIENRQQYSLNLLDITVKRNAFGAQVHSFEDTIPFPELNTQITGVFIRAPIVTKTGPQVQTLAHYDDKIVAVRQNQILGTSFHPELTSDTTLHQWFLTF